MLSVCLVRSRKILFVSSIGEFCSCFFVSRVSPDNVPKWYKFDDGEVSECKMDDEEVQALVTL